MYIFKHNGLYFLDLSINSLFPKTDELSHIAQLTNATVFRISESKLGSGLTSKIPIDEHRLLCCDRNRADMEEG